MARLFALSAGALCAGAARHRETAEAKLDKERADEAREKARAAESGQPLGKEHWQARHRAEARHRAATAIEAAVAEVATELETERRTENGSA